MTRLIAGAMSGTSADGVDVAIVEITGRGFDMSVTLVHHEHQRYEYELRRMIFHIRESGSADLSTLARCGREISLSYARAIRAALTGAGVTAKNLAAVAAHGQTLYHAPPDTIQWLDPSLVAAEVGCEVVSDFRRADCAVGGQGAPLVPFADYILFRHKTISRALVNLGGIANLTYLPAGASTDQVRAFDTGPGNCISDFLMREHDPSGPGVDIDGRLASEGSVVPELANAVQKHPLFALRGPKSTDGPAMIRAYTDARARLGRDWRLEDQLATACAVTADQICLGLRVFGAEFSGEVIVSGGGTHNRRIMQLLESQVGPVRRIDEFGIPSEAKEAVAFALLGAASLDGIPSNIPSCTGARRAVVLGSVTAAP